ncbi:casein kinase II subunit beta-1 [Morus notabilis]|uniref:casein kinase II subunit beta-1 n=1 Tax=Morus notabilis TaxID=981085 RepID=UPI000CED1C46|nr:casein kinase II subunit beta-1 [Morus notabilis]
MISDSVPSTSSPTKDVNDTTYEEESERSSKNLEVSDGDRDDEDEDEEVSWVTWLCNQKGNEFFCQVDDGYLLDDSNLSGLSSQVPCYDYALDLILDVESSHDEFTDEQNDLVEWAAEMLYGLIHARYILTSQGMAAMLEKYRSYDFGTCPRFHCNKQRCLPVGESDTPRSRTVKIYCPKCEDIYAPESKHQENIDGAYFGTTFPHLFFMNNPHLRPEKANENYVPRIYGFKISK